MTSIDRDTAHHLRNYQLEMLDASMKENIIVVMDTGSGKTPIAVLRIIAELERCPPEKLIWFLAPTISLCEQQYKVISSQIPAVRSRTITGLDKVNLWTDQNIWDAVLHDVRIVISTHRVLADALGHGFVRMSRLALIVYDEAHHCKKDHPANIVMRDFYHPTLAVHGPENVPHILGLTASPTTGSISQSLSVIESNMNAVCKTPRVHRSDLLEHSNRPELLQLMFQPVNYGMFGFDTRAVALGAFLISHGSLDIEDDPYVKRLKQSPLSEEKLQAAIENGDTYCSKQLKRFLSRCFHICEELGPWATDYFMSESIKRLRNSVSDQSIMMDWDEAEKAYLARFLSSIPIPDIRLDFPANEYPLVSPKLERLIQFLDEKYHPDFSGLIFVKQRATVSAMVKVLEVHPLMKDRFRCAAFVGYSSSGNRKEALGDLHDVRCQRDTLSEFRSGHRNLIISTDVLEEGINISACSVVVCYDKPPNLKSFIQRRGRARQKKSTYAIMLTGDDETSHVDRWQELEKAMVQAYLDEERQPELSDDYEEVNERFLIESTGALLTADTAMAHLHHFCSTLPSQPYADTRPIFSLERSDQTEARKGTVILPSCVHPAVRCIQGKNWWRSDKAALKETAFQAYKALYEFGLLNDNLLPLSQKPELQTQIIADLPAVVDVSEQYDPWVDLAHSWSSPDIHQHRITVRQNRVLMEDLSMALTVPALLPALGPLTLFWDKENTFTLSFATAKRVPVTSESIQQLRAATAMYLQATKRPVAKMANDFVALFGPDIPESELENWLSTNAGSDPALDVYSLRNDNPLSMGIVRDQMRYNKPLIFKRWLVSEQDVSIVELECDPFPRRRNLLSRQTLAGDLDNGIDGDDAPTPRVRIVSAHQCTIDKLPFSQSIFGSFISSIIETLEVALIATKLCNTILESVHFSSIRHVITAITAPSACAETDYQRYEFFGDSVLKFTVSCQLFFQHPNWHEGYLSENRDQIVQNPRLARAALDAGLDAFIINRRFAPRKWSAPLISERIKATCTQRKMSTKVLADVVEALIGAAYVDSGMETAQTVIRRFLPSVDLATLDTESIQRQSRPEASHLMNRKLPEHVGHHFDNESLLVEALTHPSCDYDPTTQSYQRLEFLGDAVLDIIVVTALSKHALEIPQGEMTMIKAACVNANLLAFFCMDFTISSPTTDVAETTTNKFEITPVEQHFALWNFLRCRDQVLELNRDASLSRYSVLRTQIAEALLSDSDYPWLLLSQINAEKFFSDIIESILGAIFVDSNGDLSACESFVEKIGLLPYLRRVLDDRVNVVHPKNAAQRMAKLNVLFDVKRVKAGCETGEDGDDEVDSDDVAGIRYRCSATLNSVQVAVEEGLSREEAEVRAANSVVALLRERS